MGKLHLAAVLCALLAAACSSTPKAEDASSKQNDQAQTDATDTPRETADKGGDGKGDDGKTDGKSDAPSGGVKVNGVERNDGNSVPDDYSLTERDCNDLGKKFAELWGQNLRAQLSPKLNAKQREKAEESINEGTASKEQEEVKHCLPLVDKNIDPAVLKCAFNSKTVEAYQKCFQ
jgi:hypothetical protein